jgi:hypothetical protein
MKRPFEPAAADRYDANRIIASPRERHGLEGFEPPAPRIAPAREGRHRYRRAPPLPQCLRTLRGRDTAHRYDAARRPSRTLAAARRGGGSRRRDWAGHDEASGRMNVWPVAAARSHDRVAAFFRFLGRESQRDGRPGLLTAMKLGGSLAGNESWEASSITSSASKASSGRRRGSFPRADASAAFARCATPPVAVNGDCEWSSIMPNLLMKEIGTAANAPERRTFPAQELESLKKWRRRERNGRRCGGFTTPNDEPSRRAR